MKLDTEQIASAILDMAENGAPRPRQLAQVEGRFLSYFVCKSSRYYDAELDAKIRALRPDWFRKPTHDAAGSKQKILDHARAGLPRNTLPKRLNTALGHYRHPKGRSYDLEFTKEIESLCPDWFRKKLPR